LISCRGPTLFLFLVGVACGRSRALRRATVRNPWRTAALRAGPHAIRRGTTVMHRHDHAHAEHDPRRCGRRPGSLRPTAGVVATDGGRRCRGRWALLDATRYRRQARRRPSWAATKPAVATDDRRRRRHQGRRRRGRHALSHPTRAVVSRDGTGSLGPTTPLVRPDHRPRRVQRCPSSSTTTPLVARRPIAMSVHDDPAPPKAVEAAPGSTGRARESAHHPDA
jgi:hypothetical protein